MTNTPESAELKQRFERKDTEALLRVAHARPGDYRPEAVELARQVLATRDVALDDPSTQVVLAELEQERVAAGDEAAQRLSRGLKPLCFVFCGIPGILIAIVQGGNNHTRRAHDAWVWVGNGWLARIVLLFIGIILRSI